MTWFYKPFSGILDGDSHVITNLFIQSSASDYTAGLFGYTDGATLCNLTIENCTINGAVDVGALCGSTHATTIKNCTVSGTITYRTMQPQWADAGGLVGYVEKGTVQDCHAAVNITLTNIRSPASAGGLIGNVLLANVINSSAQGDITATADMSITAYTGGLIGHFGDGIVKNCYARGRATAIAKGDGHTYSGGLIGFFFDGAVEDCYAQVHATANSKKSACAGGLLGAYESDSTMKNCYALGDVEGTSDTRISVGGLIGETNDSAALISCYAAGKVTADGTGTRYSGGLMGSFDGGTLANCYYDKETTTCTDEGKGEGKTTAEMKSQAMVDMLNGTQSPAPWGVVAGNYPHLIAFPPPPDWLGSGTEATPYQISNREDLEKLAQKVNDGTPYAGTYFKLMNDLDLGGKATPWTPIGNGASNAFAGIFEGHNHIISNLCVEHAETGYYAGLFGYADGATFRSLGIENAEIAGKYGSGALVGWLMHGQVTKCYSTGAVEANHTDLTEPHAGGLIGYCQNTTLEESYSTARVAQLSNGNKLYLGGLIGYASQTNIIQCYATGAVTLTSTGMGSPLTFYAGGLVGYYTYGTLNTCYAEGAVTATASRNAKVLAGGMFGLYDGNQAMVDCFATGSVTATAALGNVYVGGLSGSFLTSSTVSRCYAAGTITANGAQIYSGGFVGMTTADLSDRLFYDQETTGQSDEGKGTPKTTAQMKSQAMVDMLNGTQSPAPWVFITGQYPQLSAFTPAPPPPKQYELTVHNGSGSGKYAVGTSVTITADAPAEGKVFDQWTGDVDVLSDPRLNEVTFAMPEHSVTLTAQYVAKTDDYNLVAVPSREEIALTWNSGVASSCELWRSPAGEDKFQKIATIPSSSGERTGYVDDDFVLRYGQAYDYYVVGKKVLTPSAHAIAMLQSEKLSTKAFITGAVSEIVSTEIASSETIGTFAKPTVTAYYADPAKLGKTKKIKMIVDKDTYGQDTLRVYNKTEISLYNSKNFNKRNKLAHDYAKDDETYENGQLKSLNLSVTIKKVNAENKEELRTYTIFTYFPPSITAIVPNNDSDSNVIFDENTLTLPLLKDDYDLRVGGYAFGIKTPKAWVEYVDDKGKVKKQSLKVNPMDKNIKAPLTNSSITDHIGTSRCLVTIPSKKWSADRAKGKDVPYKSFVISTGKAFDAVPLEIK